MILEKPCLLYTLQCILLEIGQITCNDTPATEVGKRIVAHIKTMMNDRARSQKALNDLLESYRTGILPSVVSNWAELSCNEQESMATMYHFFCGVHFIGNMADHAAEALKLFEAAYRDEQSSSSKESTTCTVFVACKAFERHGDEKSGFSLKIATFFKRKGIHRVPLAHFKGSIFFFTMQEGSFFLYRHHITEFLTMFGAYQTSS